MHSPVSSMALGECNAITSGDSAYSRLTFVGNLETTFGASHKDVCRDQSVGYASGLLFDPGVIRGDTPGDPRFHM